MPVERERVSAGGFFPPWIQHEHLARYRFAAERAAGALVVECACGDGAYTPVLAERARFVHGFDIDPDSIAEARRGVNRANVAFTAADATALPLEERCADAYVSLETIEHLEDADAFLREASRVLKPDGTLICSTPDRDVYSPGNGPKDRPWNRFHVKEYTQSEFAALLARHFDEIELFGQNPRSPGAVRLKATMGRSTPGHLMVRLNQALKLPRFAYDRMEHHLLHPCDPERRYELLTAVCTRPKLA